MSFTEEQRAERRGRYWASEISAIVGLSPWQTPLDVFNEKIGQGTPLAMNENMERGTFLEPGMRNWYAKRTGKRVHVPGMVPSRRHPLMGASPDGLVFDEQRSEHESEAVLEIKVPGEWAIGWGPDGSQEVPIHYICQGAWQAAVCEVPRIDFAALIRGKLHVYPVPRDIEFEGMLIERVERFHRDHVEPRKPPPATLPDLEWLKKKFPRAELDYLDADEQAEALAQRYANIRDAREVAEKQELELRAQLEQLIGAHAGLRGKFGQISWKHSKDSQRTDWVAVVQELRNMIELRVSVAQADEDDHALLAMKELLQACNAITTEKTRTVAGARPFVAKLKRSWDE